MNILKKRWKKEVKLVLIAIALSLIFLQAAFAADPGHVAGAISTGQFESGNYTFPDSLHIDKYLNVTGLLYVDPLTNMVGIGTTGPDKKLTVSSAGTGDIEILIKAVTTGSTGYPAIQVDRNSNARTATMRFSTAGTDDWVIGTPYSGGNPTNQFIIGPDHTLANAKMVILNDGNVGIGTAGPGYKLDVNGTSNFNGAMYIQAQYPITFANGQTIRDNGGGGLLIDVATYSLSLKAGTDSSAVLDLWTGGAARMTILNNGNVGIGTTAPTQKLNVDGAANFTGDVFLPTQSLSSCTGKLITSADGNVTCGTDATGSTDLTNVAFVNQSNTFAANYNQTFDTNTLFVDAESDRVGIGTTSPGAKLDIYNGNIYFSQEGNQIEFNLPGSGAAYYVKGGTEADGRTMYFGSRTSGVGLTFQTYDDDFKFNSGNPETTRMIIQSGGNVGIGTTSPTKTLDVRGDIYTNQSVLLNATSCNTLDTTADGLIICGTDEGGAGDLSNYAVTNTTAQSFAGLVNFAANVSIADNLTVGGNVLYVDSSSGSVGIGTASPGVKLQVNDAHENTTIMIRPDNGAGNRTSNLDFWGTFFDYGADTQARRVATIRSGFSTGVWGTEYMSFGLGSNDAASLPTERMRIDGSGNVGIGTTAPTHTFSTQGTMNITRAAGQAGGIEVASTGDVIIRLG